MLKFLPILIILSFLSACGGGKYQENMSKIDELYGYCDNPARGLKKGTVKYKDCMAKQRAQGEQLFDLDGDLNDLIKGRNQTIVQYTVNPSLWSASLEVTEKYALKIADNQGGYIETDWIYDTNNTLQRCLIKIKITSQELISTGVESVFVCENKQNDLWISDKKDYSQEEKQLTLKILDLASTQANTSL